MKNTRLKIMFCTLALAVCTSWASTNATAADKYAGYQELVAETHKNSLIARENSYRLTAKHGAGLGGVWAKNVWSLSQLMANENLEDANARLRSVAETYLSEYAVYAPKKSGTRCQETS